jgi:putative transposase
MRYHRYFQPGGTFFFTVVTYNRNPIFTKRNAILLFNQSIDHVQDKHPFINIAYCICPDHIHMIWTMPDNDTDYPMRWRLIKSHFSHHWVNTGIVSQRNIYNSSIWQNRYWEHFIRNELDLKNHIEYIHFNPVKHGYVEAPSQWVHSSFHNYVKRDLYSKDWGVIGNMNYLNRYGNE